MHSLVVVVTDFCPLEWEIFVVASKVTHLRSKNYSLMINKKTEVESMLNFIFEGPD